MCSKQNRRFKSKPFQYVYRNKWLRNINRAYINAYVNGSLMVKDASINKIGMKINVGVSAKIKKM